MSISPTDAQTSASSSTRSLPRNPNSSSHGLRSSINHRDRRIQAAAVAPVAAPGHPLDELVGSSGTTIGIYGGSCDLSENVIELPELRKESSGRNRHTVSQRQPPVQGGVSSQFRSDQLEPAQIHGEQYRIANFIHSDHMTLGSRGLQVSAAQSVSRRNQVVSANHLLNFRYDPISRQQSHPRILPTKRQHKIKPYNKDLFLQANYKFVVLDTGSYRLGSMDPDKMLQWEDVVSVKYSTPFSVQCPICLDSPLCPQITSCGHIYCFPCILQYLLMGEEDHKGLCWKKCPLCFTMISSKDLYTLHIESVNEYHVGDHACFTLLTRPKDSLVPSVKNQQGGVHLMPHDSTGTCDIFSKFILTTDVELSVRDAKSDLSSWLRKAESGFVDDLEKLPYVYAAMEQLEERMNNWMDHRVYTDNPLTPLPSNLKGSHTLTKMQQSVTSNSESNKSDSREPALCASSEPENIESSGKIGAEYAPLPVAAVPGSNESSEKGILKGYVEGKSLDCNTSKDIKERDSYAFYQAIDGQHLILHPLNMKCLLHHYGSYELLPQRINGKILEMETVTQSEAMRRRYRYLSHFSLTTTFQLCEIDLSEILPPISLVPFIEEIRKREKQRKRLAKKEEDDRARAEAAALPDWSVPFDRSHLPHKDVGFSLDDFTALGSNVAVPSTSPPITSERKLFSNVTRLGFAAAHDSPSLKSEESADLSRHVEKTGETSSIQGPRATPALSFANIIATPKPTVSPPEAHKNNGYGKKGKKPTRVLLSTSGERRY